MTENSNMNVKRSSTKFGNDATEVVLGDCVEALNDVADASVDLVFADPPYNIGKRFGAFRDSWPSDADYAEWCFGWLDLCIKKLNARGSLYLMSSTQAMPLLDQWVRQRLIVLSRIVWHYDSSGVQAKRYYGSMYEPVLFCVRDPKAYTFNDADIEVEARTGAVRKLIDYRKKTPTVYKSTKVPGNVWFFPRVRYRMPEYENHPSQKPEALLERIIRASTNPGDLVLDPFAGSFTTCAVAQRLDRRSIGIEANVDYVKAGIRRLGLATHFQGEQLKPLVKNTARRNGKGKRVPTQETGPDLFHD